MHPDLEDMLTALPKDGEVFVCRATEFESDEWRVYQERELKYWQDKYDSGYYPDYKESFYKTLTKFGIGADDFSGKQLLEIGCGPQGFSASLVQMAKNQPSSHVIVDSLLDKYQDFPTFSLFGRDTIKIKALGEQIPVPSNFFDIVVCQNVLDHVNQPLVVINEICRILKKDGIALISVHVLSPFFKLFNPLIKQLDKNHPHHFTHEYFSSLLSDFKIIHDHTMPLYKDNPNLPKSIKAFLAMRLLSTTYVKVQKI